MKKPGKTRRLKELRELRIKNFFVLTIAGIVNAFGVSFFLFPVRLYDSGVSGVSMLLDQVTPSSFTLSLFLLLLNVPIFLFGLKDMIGFNLSSGSFGKQFPCHKNSRILTCF